MPTDIARRLAGPIALVAACLAAWGFSTWLGDLTVDRATRIETTDRTVEAPMTSVRRLPSLATSSLRGQRIAEATSAIPDLPAPLACLTVMVDGEVVHRDGTSSGLVPGVSQMLLTGHAALDLLGPGHRFETRVMAEQLPDENGWVLGDLHLIGGGDPVLMSYNYARGFRPVRSTYTPIEDLADAVAAAGVELVQGRIIGNERRYDRQRVLPGWPAELIESGRTGPLSALQLDDALAERPAANLGVAVPADDPALHAAERFAALLAARDIFISQPPRSDELDDELPELVPVASVSSAPLEEIVFQMWAVNDASAAEMLMKELGLRYAQTGSTQAGGDAVQFVLAGAGVELDVAPRDGSGLDPVSTLTCDTLAATAEAIPLDHPTVLSLPDPGLPGVHDGALTGLELDADVRTVGGTVGETTSMVATTVDDGRRVTIASIINRLGPPAEADAGFHRELVAQIDVLREAWADVDLEGAS